jgi:hypothetical protein
LIVFPSPPFGQYLGFQQRVEDLAIEMLVAELAVEALAVAIFPETFGSM